MSRTPPAPAPSATRVAVVGAGGFVGRALTTRLIEDGREVIPIVRKSQGLPGERVVSDIAHCGGALDQADVVVNLAARVHMMRDEAADPLAEYRKVNCAGAIALAREARDAGARRYIYMSSIKVNGEDTDGREPFTADERPEPLGAYAKSKWEAEQALLEIAGSSGLEVAIIRPPLVYGPGVRANFRAMMKWLRRGVPLPLGAVDNRRSLIGVGNLASLVGRCIDHPGAANRIFLASDGCDVSTPRLLRMLASALGSKARLLPVPPALLAAAAAALGKRDSAERLLGSLQIDIAKTRDLLEWEPPYSVEEELRQTAADYLENERA